MATINITVQSLLNAALYDSYAVDDAGTIGELKDSIESTTDCSVEWFDLVFDNEVLDTAETIGSYGIVEGSSLRTHNKIARLANRELRQKAKLDLAALDRDASDNPRAVYDITQLPTQYDGNTIVDNPNSDGDGGILLVQGRPWIEVAGTPTYNVEFREWIGDVEGVPGNVITTINEGQLMCFVVTGTNVPVIADDEDSYLMFSGANITAEDGFWLAGDLTDQFISMTFVSGNIVYLDNSPIAPIVIFEDDTTEGNETLTLTWNVYGNPVATASVTIVDTSIDENVPLQVSLITAPSSGTTWTDASTFGRNATLRKTGSGNYSYTASNGGGITTTGSTGTNGAIIDIPYNLPSTFTIEIVASVSATGYWASLFGNEVFTSDIGFIAYWNSDTTINIGAPYASEAYTMTSGQKANRNHYVITVTGTTLKFYINGSLKTKTSGTFAQPTSYATNGLQIGARHPNAGTSGTPNDSAHGTYYRVQVWNVVKTDSEVNDLYTAAATAHNL